MKLKIMILNFLMVFVLVNINAQEAKKDYSLASVGEKIYGVYIFVHSKPYYDYKYIATIRVKINWSGTTEEALRKSIKKAKKKYPYFNGMIFKDSKYNEVDLIRFDGLDVSRGGISINTKVSFFIGRNIYYGTVAALESSRNKASVKYKDRYGEYAIRKVKYVDLTPIDSNLYKQKIEELDREFQKKKVINGDKVIWSRKGEIHYGEVISLNPKSHKVKIKYKNDYGEQKVLFVDQLKVQKITEDKFNENEKKLDEEIAKHKFKLGDKVTWVKHKTAGKMQQYVGEIIKLNDKSHKASVKYQDENGEEKITEINYLKLTKSN